MWTRPWDGGSRWQPQRDNDAVGNRQARRQDSLKNPGLVAFTLGCRYRGKVLFPAFWPPIVVLSWCIFFGIAFVSLPFHVKTTTCCHSQLVMTVPCCFRRPYYPLLLILQKPLFGPQSKGLAQVTSGVPSHPNYSKNLWRRHLAPNQAGERWIHAWVAGRPYTLSGKYDGWFNESLWVCGLCLPVGEICFTPALSPTVKK